MVALRVNSNTDVVDVWNLIGGSREHGHTCAFLAEHPLLQ